MAVPSGYAVSWSGGKDAAVALLKARSSGVLVRWLFSMIGPEERSRGHGVPSWVLRAQAERIGVPLVFGRAAWEGYELEFRRVLTDLARGGLEGCVFGDIDIEGHRSWCRRVCSEMGLEALHPLWGLKQETVLEEFLGAGFKAVITAVDLGRLDVSWLGRILDRKAVSELTSSGVTPCGELGEYHTLVIDGPIFRAPLAGAALGQGFEVRDGYGFLRFPPGPVGAAGRPGL